MKPWAPIPAEEKRADDAQTSILSLALHTPRRLLAKEASTVGSHILAPDVPGPSCRDKLLAFAVLLNATLWLHDTLPQARFPQLSCFAHHPVTPNPTEIPLLCCLGA